MTDIDIRRAHGLNHAEARRLAGRLASDLGGHFGLSHEWQGDVLQFQGVGIDGSIAVEAADVHIRVQLGFLLKPMRPVIERSIHSELDKLLQI